MPTQSKPKRQTALEVILSERINLGGEIITRKEAYDRLIEEGCGARCSDFFAFSTPVWVEEQEESRNVLVA